MGSYNSVVTMKSLKIISSLSLILSSSTPVSSINFPGLSDTSSSSPFSSSAVSADRPAVSVNNGLVFGRNTFTTASCTDDGVALNTIILNIGEGRVFHSLNYPSAYPNGQTCTYNFEPASGAQLKFSCTDMDLTATSAAGDLCTGDYLRFYDESGQLGQSGERYCFTNKPDFTYTSNIKVLFKTNNDAQQGKGFDKLWQKHCRRPLQPPPPQLRQPLTVSLLMVQVLLNHARRCSPMDTGGSPTRAVSTRRPRVSI